jgi:A/G-specific adenine glycosylase
MKKNGAELETRFARLLLKWNKEQNDRVMPWKGEKDPYRIWLSEIILQQTRVEQGWAYYDNFVRNFPDVHRLAAARDEKVFKLWEGLGYYTRCRNLLITARYISKEQKGKFPGTYEAIKSLKGIGPYTASAIASFAFNLPHAVVDGNVFRVLARIFGISIPTDSTAGKKYFTALADRLLDKKQPGLYNQAIMDFGAVICKPVAPLCHGCVFRKDCFANLNDKISELPVKEKKLTIKKRWFFYFVLENKQGQEAIVQRTGKDIWQGLFEFPVIEMKSTLPVKKILQQAEKNNWLIKGKYELIEMSPLFRQQLSHQLITAQFIRIQIKQSQQHGAGWIWVSRNQRKNYAFPGIINQFLNPVQKHNEPFRSI